VSVIDGFPHRVVAIEVTQPYDVLICALISAISRGHLVISYIMFSIHVFPKSIQCSHSCLDCRYCIYAPFQMFWLSLLLLHLVSGAGLFASGSWIVIC
jgi:hypothetical protein